MNSAIVAAEASAATAFCRSEMLPDPERRRSRLIVSARDGVAHVAFTIHICDVRFMREQCAVGPADIFRGIWLDTGLHPGMADCAAGFL